MPARSPARLKALWLFALVCLTLAGLGGSGCMDGADEADGYYLDNPDLADQAGGEIVSGVPVLCYHYFRGQVDPGYLARVTGSLLFGLPALSPKEFWTTPVGEFRRHLQHFRDTGTVVMTLDEVHDLLAAGQTPPSRAVVLTIDDADISVYEQAYPLLREFGVRAHVFVPTGRADRIWSGVRTSTWDQLAEMADSGFVLLESHSHRLHFKIDGLKDKVPVFWRPQDIPEAIRLDNLVEIGRHRASAEVAAQAAARPRGNLARFSPVFDDLLVSRILLQERTGAGATWLAWPYGFGNGDLDSVAVAAGFVGTVSLHPRTFDRPGNPRHVGRFTITAKTTVEQIEALFPAPPGRPGSAAGLPHP